MTPRPTPLPVRVEGIPEALKAERRWVCWKYTWREENGKPGKWTKPLYVATATEQKADATDPATWRAFDDALAAYEDGKSDGVGFVLGDGWVGFDADGNDAPEYVSVLNTYTERSPSGMGIHVIGKGTKPGPKCRKGREYELYDHGRYFTVTGHHVAGTPLTVEERTAEIATVYGSLFAPDSDGHAPTPPPSPPSLNTLTDDAVVAKASAAPKSGEKFTRLWAGNIAGYPSHSEADLALCAMLAFWTDRDAAQIDRLFRRSGLMREKWERVGADLIAKAIASTPKGYEARDTTKPATRLLTLQPASELSMRRAVYLWEQRLPVGMLALLAGREGIGKSLISQTVAADLTRGRLKGCYDGTPKGVIIVATEDAWEFVILPRLRAAGADTARCFRVNVATEKYGALELSLPDDLPALKPLVVKHEIGLIVLDPIISRLGKKLDTHVDAEVRQALEPLRAFAEALRLSVLGIIHPNKSQVGIPTDPLNSIMGSRAFSAVSRSTLFLQADPDGSPLYLLHVKNNVGPVAPTLECTIRDAVAGFDEEGEEVRAPQVDWLGERDPEERWQALLSDLRKKEHKADAPDSARDDAVEFLQRYLKAGPVESTKVIKAATEAGITKRTMQRAADDMNVARTWTQDSPPRLLWGLAVKETGVTEDPGF